MSCSENSGLCRGERFIRSRISSRIRGRRRKFYCPTEPVSPRKPERSMPEWLNMALSSPTQKKCPTILRKPIRTIRLNRSEEHTSELQSRGHLVCRLLLEKKKH